MFKANLTQNISSWPLISIVTPSFNQGQFIEMTIRSILDQGYPNLEYVIIDGGSTDGSTEIIQKHEGQLAYWVSEPDGGQYDAINKGFSKTTGEIMAWLNSDDKYTPWALSVVAEIFTAFPQVEWLTTTCAMRLNQAGVVVKCGHNGGFNPRAFFKGANLPGRNWYSSGWIQQESTFWRRSLWDRTGGNINSSLKLAGDFALWTKFFRHADLYAVSSPLGCFRMHENQKTANQMQTYLEEAETLLREYGGRPYGKLESAIRRFFYFTLGYRAIPKDVLPPLLAAVICNLPLFYSVKLCNWKNDGGWYISDGYII